MVYVGGTLWANFTVTDLGPSTPPPALRPWFRLEIHGLSSESLPIPRAGFPGVCRLDGHLAAQENWTTTFTLVNKGGAAAQLN